jgi:hypothetical protein
VDDLEGAVIVPSPLIGVELDLRLDLRPDRRLVVSLDDTSTVVGTADVVSKVASRVDLLLVAVGVGNSLKGGKRRQDASKKGENRLSREDSSRRRKGGRKEGTQRARSVPSPPTPR